MGGQAVVAELKAVADGQRALGVAGGLELLHPPFSSSRRLVRHLPERSGPKVARIREFEAAMLAQHA